MKKILVIAPHPDDEVLGCGGTIARLAKEGNEIHLCVMTEGYSPDWPEKHLQGRAREIRAAQKALGISKVHFLKLPTVKLDTIPRKNINDLLSRVVLAVDPDVAYIPHAGDLNLDHRIAFETALVALRPRGKQSPAILSYEVLSETEWGIPTKLFSPTVYINITKTFSQKLKAMKAYKSELRPFPHPRSLKALEALAIKRGSEVLVARAEAFALIREVVI